MTCWNIYKIECKFKAIGGIKDTVRPERLKISEIKRNYVLLTMKPDPSIWKMDLVSEYCYVGYRHKSVFFLKVNTSINPFAALDG